MEGDNELTWILSIVAQSAALNLGLQTSTHMALWGKPRSVKAEVWTGCPENEAESIVSQV